MRAALYDEYGTPDVLYVGNVPKPEAGPGQVLVRVAATSVNGGELHARSGRIRFLTGLWARGEQGPKRTGIDFTGEIAAVGPGVSGFAPGDRVWGVLGRAMGSVAEFLAVPANRVAHAPRELDLVQAAALPVGTTAVTALRDKAKLRAGERLLVRGASGGVGSIAVQLGAALGARVTGLAGTRNLDLVRELGAAEAVDYRKTGVAELGRFDVVLDTVGTDLRGSRAALAPGGRMVSIAFDTERPVSSIGYILGSTVFGKQRVRFFSGNPYQADLAELTRLTENGLIAPVVDRVHPLADIAKAHQDLESGGVRGKILVEIG
ncbi:NAD(P)-dependent alcohol dehydrogenase [Sciscionella sediminilitoris]|uniref:NAD(P)-dependent alcohol dehydrogenase n=1 Tax=Sciscionella sediminilitoris TaxID=1445613 RepID=UPI0004DFA25F|nr:NAD(P)-dependent alcohol dehydrogenase [Sciscionella sp. SE31]